MVFIYVLQLKEDKWYIGKTESSKFRIDTHFDSKGSGFTKKYPPEEIYQIIPECDKYDEDKYVKKYMDKYGIDNVRGGSFSRLELTEEEKKSIQKELWGANDLCFLCGGDHFVKDCPNNIMKDVEKVIDDEYKIDDKLITTMKQHIFTSDFNLTPQPSKFVETTWGRAQGLYNVYYDNSSRKFVANNFLQSTHSKAHSKAQYINIAKNIVIDQFIFNQYINNSDIMNQFNKYIDLCSNVESNDISKYYNTQKLKNVIENNLIDLLTDIIYLELNKYITNKFNTTEYLIFNFSVENSLHISDYISLIYRNDKLNKLITVATTGEAAQITMFGQNYFKRKIFGLDNKHESSNIKISTISINGDLWYKVN